MKNQDFQKILKERCAKINAILAAKGVEYASDVDRLHNFKYAAQYLRCTPLQACLSFMTKHLVSVADLVEQQAQGKTVTQAMVNEKVGDAINYMVLLEALFADK